MISSLILVICNSSLIQWEFTKIIDKYYTDYNSTTVKTRVRQQTEQNITKMVFFPNHFKCILILQMFSSKHTVSYNKEPCDIKIQVLVLSTKDINLIIMI